MFDLTERETEVAMILVKVCLDGMGGTRPCDLEDDEYTWIAPDDLKVHGYTQAQIRGFWSSLTTKGVVGEYDTNEWVLETDAWRFLDTIWDLYQANRNAVG